MKRLSLLCAAAVAGSLFLLSGCETKVYNQEPAARPTVIEHDRPVVTEHENAPPVRNDIHVDR